MRRRTIWHGAGIVVLDQGRIEQDARQRLAVLALRDGAGEAGGRRRCAPSPAAARRAPRRSCRPAAGRLRRRGGRSRPARARRARARRARRWAIGRIAISRSTTGRVEPFHSVSGRPPLRSSTRPTPSTFRAGVSLTMISGLASPRAGSSAAGRRRFDRLPGAGSPRPFRRRVGGGDRRIGPCWAATSPAQAARIRTRAGKADPASAAGGHWESSARCGSWGPGCRRWRAAAIPPSTRTARTATMISRVRLGTGERSGSVGKGPRVGPVAAATRQRLFARLAA